MKIKIKDILPEIIDIIKVVIATAPEGITDDELDIILSSISALIKDLVKARLN